MELDNERHALPPDDVSAKGDRGGIRALAAELPDDRLGYFAETVEMRAVYSVDGGAL
jgi:hypothetical protein